MIILFFHSLPYTVMQLECGRHLHQHSIRVGRGPLYLTLLQTRERKHMALNMLLYSCLPSPLAMLAIAERAAVEMTTFGRPHIFYSWTGLQRCLEAVWAERFKVEMGTCHAVALQEISCTGVVQVIQILCPASFRGRPFREVGRDACGAVSDRAPVGGGEVGTLATPVGTLATIACATPVGQNCRTAPKQSKCPSLIQSPE